MTRIGIVGAGRLGHRHVHHLSRLPDIEFVIYDVDGDRARTLALTCGGVIAGSFEECIDQVDALDVLTPNDLHSEYASAALRHGKHVFIEKPLAHSLASAQTILDAAASSPQVAMVGHVVRYFPAYQLAREQVQRGAVGKPAAIRMTRGGSAPGTADSWFQDHARSGGVFIDLGVHDFDWIRWTFGPVQSVTARSVGASTGAGPDYGLATLTLASGAIAHVESVWMDPDESRMAFEVCGREGMLEFDTRTSASVRKGQQLEQSSLPGDDPYFLQLRDFVRACRREIENPIPVSEGFEALRIACAALESAKSGRTVSL